MAHRVAFLTALAAGLLFFALAAAADDGLQQEQTADTPPTGEAAPATEQTGGIVHGAPQDGLAAFLLAGSTQFTVGEPVPLSYGLLCVELPEGLEAAGRKVEVAQVLEAVDPHNGSWFSATGPDGQALPYRGEFVSWKANRPKMLMRQGEFVGKTSDLAASFDLAAPGKYRVVWHHGWAAPDLASNELEFEIVPADAAALPAAAENVQPPEVRILSGIRTTFDSIPFASFACELRNAGQTPLMFVGYRPDSFDPQLVAGQVSPIYSIEVRRGDAWEEYPIGWCGTGMDGIALAPDGGGGTFGFAVLMDPPWDAVRVGVRWSLPIDFATAEADAYQTAWSEPFAFADLAPEPQPAGEPPPPAGEPPPVGAALPAVDPVAAAAAEAVAVALPHGDEIGGLAAFLLPQRTQYKPGEPIALSYGIACLAVPPGGDPAQPGIEVLKPLRAVDPNNLSWFTVVGPDGQELEYRGFYVSWAAVDGGDARLAAGDLAGTSSTLNEMFDLSRPGVYRLRWHYGWLGVDLASNEVAIEIAP